jgi:glycine dehydrogenase subunit 1
MLSAIGARSINDLFKDVPAAARLDGPVWDLPNHQGELEVERRMGALAAKNIPAGSVPFFCGAGAYRHHVPAAVDQILLRGEFLTSYTPYQPEVSQGTLHYLFEFQTQVALLTGMDVANASMYDGSTACMEAVTMAGRVTHRNKAILSGGLHPHYRDIILTHADLAGFKAEALPETSKQKENLAAKIDADTSCVVIQTPDVFGRVHQLQQLADACHKAGALLIVVVTEIVSLGLLPPPGQMGADIVVCEGQGIGVGLNFGGPYVGLFAAKEQYIRQMPGRLVGETVDAENRRGFVLTLSTREQHIRREKATSNICTNSGLCALAFTIHLTLLGEEGLKGLARLNHARAVQASQRLADVPGVKLLNDSFFNEFALELSKPAAGVVDHLAKQNILAGVPASRLDPHAPGLKNILLVTVTETATDAHVETLAKALQKELA